jgi:hypothetical protein
MRRNSDTRRVELADDTVRVFERTLFGGDRQCVKFWLTSSEFEFRTRLPFLVSPASIVEQIELEQHMDSIFLALKMRKDWMPKPRGYLAKLFSWALGIEFLCDDHMALGKISNPEQLPSFVEKMTLCGYKITGWPVSVTVASAPV